MIASSFLFVALAVAGQNGAKASLDAAKLVGVWEVATGTQPPPGSTLELSADGKFKATVKGQNISFVGTYKLADGELVLTPPGVGMMVKELTKDKLVVSGSSTVEYKRRGPITRAEQNAQMPVGGFGINIQSKSNRTVTRTGTNSGRWTVVNGDLGGYTVELPGQPNGRESESGGGVTAATISYQSQSVEYIVTTLQGPTAIPDEQTKFAIEQSRKRMLEKYGQNVEILADKPVKLGKLEGLEFDASLDRSGVGPTKAKGRMFASDKTIYMLLAIARAKNAEVPTADASHFLTSLKIGGVASESMAKGGTSARTSPLTKAGTRRPETNAMRTFGQEVDPDGDVEIKPDGKNLLIMIPGTAHVLAPERDKMNAPRVVSPVRGNFVVTVRVDGTFNPRAPSTVKGLSPRQTGGLILWKDAKNYLVFQRRVSVGDEEKMANQAVLEELVGGKKGVTHRQPAGTEGPLYLRVERKGSRISADFSHDGQTWKDLKPVDTTWAEGTIQVGVVGVNTSPGPHSVSFEDYSLKAK